MNLWKQSRPGVLLALVSAITIVVDTVSLLNGTFDVNRHVPFLVPFVLGAFAGFFFWIRYLDTLTPEQHAARQKDDEARERLALYRQIELETLHLDSAFHPDNLPTRSAEDGRF